jgi:FkbM family methyltransferase
VSIVTRNLVQTLKQHVARSGLQGTIAPVISILGRAQRRGVERIFYEDGVWIHRTSREYFAYPHPYVRLDLARFDALTRKNFFWGYTPQPGDTILDIGAGVGEETLTFSRTVGNQGRVVCIEAHPRTFQCLQKLISYNRLQNVTALQRAIAEPSQSFATIQDDVNYVANRLQSSSGLEVAASTVDEVVRDLRLDVIHFLKMNIEGAERFAILEMAETIRRTAIVCISCHDFLAASGAEVGLRTKEAVRKFLSDSGFTLASRMAPGLPPYLYDQVWAFNAERLVRVAS